VIQAGKAAAGLPQYKGAPNSVGPLQKRAGLKVGTPPEKNSTCESGMRGTRGEKGKSKPREIPRFAQNDGVELGVVGSKGGSAYRG